MASAPRPVWGDLATTAFVESSHLFKSLDPDARRDLLQVATLIDLAPGEVLPADADEAFYLVRDGSAAILVAGTPPAEPAHLERGAFFGEGRVLGTATAAALSALTEVTLVAFPAPVIGAIAERFPKVRKLLEAVLAARERDAAERPPP